MLSIKIGAARAESPAEGFPDFFRLTCYEYSSMLHL